MASWSQATATGVGFPGYQTILMVDVVGGYVQMLVKPWTVYQPGLDQLLTVCPIHTLTNAEFDELEFGLSRTATGILRGTYDPDRDTWTYPAINDNN